jgi:glycogen operon protein
VQLCGNAIEGVDAQGHPLTDANFVVLFNAHDGAIDFQLPRPAEGHGWHIEVDTASETGAKRGIAGAAYPLQGRSLVLLREAPGS